MRYPLAVSMAFLGSLTALPAGASGDGDLWVGPAAMVCLANYPQLSSTPLGAPLTGMPQFMQSVEAIKTSGCLDPRQTLSMQFCKDLLSQDPEAKPDLSAMYQRYGHEIRGLEKVLSCTEKVASDSEK